MSMPLSVRTINYYFAIALRVSHVKTMVFVTEILMPYIEALRPNSINTLGVLLNQ